MEKTRHLINGRTQDEWDIIFKEHFVIESKKKKDVNEELIEARHEMNNAWIRLDEAITNYNLHFLKLDKTKKTKNKIV